MVTVFPSILNHMEIHLVQNRKENCHHDHIPFNVKGKGNTVFSVPKSLQLFGAGSLTLLIESTVDGKLI